MGFKKFIQHIFVLYFLGLIVSCSAHHDPAGNPIDDSNGSQGQTLNKILENPQEIVFSHIKKFVIDTSCKECHDPSQGILRGDVDLSTYAGAFGQGSKKTVTPFNPEQSSIYTTLISLGALQMPPANKPQLSEDQKTLVYEWILNGAKQEASQVVERPTSLREELDPYFQDPKIIDYKLVNKYVFKTNCNDCHSSKGSKANFDNAILYGQDMTDYEAVFTNFGIVKDQLVDKVVSVDGVKKTKKGSRIYKSIAVHQTMPRPKDGYIPVDSLRTKLLRMWILNCAIEDYSLITEDDLRPKANKHGKIRNCPKPPVEEPMEEPVEEADPLPEQPEES